MSLAGIDTWDGLHMVGDIFGVVECIVSEIVRAFCKMVRLHLQKKKFKLQKKPDLRF